MAHPAAATAAAPEASLTPEQGWHCNHFYYAFDRKALQRMSPEEKRAATDAFAGIFEAGQVAAPERLQLGIVAGHKADFSVMMMDPDPLKLDSVHQRLLASPLGPALTPTYSFVSVSEVSEYVPTVEQYGEKLAQEGDAPGSPAYQAKLKGYADRLPMMNRQRLTPDFPDWPASCFYPMNKIRHPNANWFTTPYSERNRMMAQHALSGRAFAGKVMQLITVAIGLDDWEWGVTLWARNPQFLKEIVYAMRFDEGSAKFAQFGPFFTSYRADARQVLRHCGLVESA